MLQISTAEEALTILNQLSPEERARLISKLAENLVQDLQHRQPKRDFYGALAHLGPAPSAEDIDEVRHEMWGEYK